MVSCPAVPAGRQLPGAERASSTTAEETDIDAVEVPLPGNDMLKFSRGVTDLDAVGKEGDSHIDSTVGDPLSKLCRAKVALGQQGPYGSRGCSFRSEVPCHPEAALGHILLPLRGV